MVFSYFPDLSQPLFLKYYIWWKNIAQKINLEHNNINKKRGVLNDRRSKIKKLPYFF